MMDRTSPAQSIAEQMLALPDDERGPFLVDVLAYAAGALVALQGTKAATEHVYRIADATMRSEP